MIRPAEHLRGGRLPREDQAVRDELIGELYQSGARQVDIADAFLVSRPTVWCAVRRVGARIPLSEVARLRLERERG